MKRKIVSLYLLMVPACLFAEQGPPVDPVGGNLVPPEILMNFREKIGLSEEQVQAIQERMETVQQQFPEKEQVLHKALAAFGETLGAEKINPAAAQEKLSAVLAAEAEIKKMQIALMVDLTNQLSAEQRARGRELVGQARGGELQRRIEQKAHRVQQVMERMAQEGNPPDAIAERMQQVHQFMQSSQAGQAERLLDQLLSELE